MNYWHILYCLTLAITVTLYLLMNIADELDNLNNFIECKVE